MKVKFYRTVQNTTYYTYRKLNTSRDTLSSRDPCWRQRLLTLLDDTAHLSQTGTGNVTFPHTARHHRNVVRVCGTQLCINVLLKKIYIIYQKLPGGHNRVLYVRKCKSIKRTQSRYESKYLCIVVFIFTDLQ